MKKFFKEFKEFALRGNVFDMAVGVMIASAFGKIVSSIVDDLLMPLISLLTGGVHFEDWYVVLSGERPSATATLAEAKEAGCAVLSYGNFISVVIDFIIVALCIFLMVKLMNKLKKPAPAAEPAKAPRLCPYCYGEVHDAATRCPHCTSVIEIPAVKE